MPQLLQNFHYYTAISAPTFQLAMQMCSLEKLKLEIHCHLPRKLHFFKIAIHSRTTAQRVI